MKRAFDKVYKEERDTVNKDIAYSLGEIIDANNNSYGVGVHLDSTFLDNLSSDERVELIKEYVKELGGQTFGAYDANGNKVDVTIATSKRFKNKSGKKVPANKDLQTKYIKNETKQEAIALVDELVLTATQSGSASPNYSHGWLDDNGKNDWEYWTAYVQDKNSTIWEATLNIANSSNGERILYDISPIKKVGQAVKSATSPTTNSISQNGENTTENRKYSFSEEKLKEKQLEVVLKANPAFNQTSTWIRNIDDILTFEEALNSDDYVDYKGEAFDPSYPYSIAENALKTGRITVYSSYPIEQGIFVSPSRMEAESYSETGKVYSKSVDLTDVAWIDPTQGQYAKVDKKYSLSSDNVAPSRNDVYGSDIMLDIPTRSDIAPVQETTMDDIAIRADMVIVKLCQ